MVSFVDVVPILNVSSEVATTEILGDDYFPVNFFVSILFLEISFISVSTHISHFIYGISNSFLFTASTETLEFQHSKHSWSLFPIND